MIKVISFGYGHGPAPEADIVVDVRYALRNPHHDPRMTIKTARDKELRDHVMGTPGARRIVSSVADLARALHATKAEVTVAFGCVGGRHRSATLAVMVKMFLEVITRAEVDVIVEHRDMDKPVLPASAHHAAVSCNPA